MNAEFFVLAFTAALNPKLLAIDLLLIENRRPRAMFLCLLLGGLSVGLTVGLLDVLVFHLDAFSSQKTVSAGVDLALGLLLLAVGALMATGRLHARRKATVPAGDAKPETPGKEEKVCGIPGASYLAGLHILITSKSSTANQVGGVILFVLIEFLLIIIPFTFLELRPEATKKALKNAQEWLVGHARQLMAYTALILGAYLTISALVRLS
jgi:hypothetical protein